MKCWYLSDAECDRKGDCEGCPKYDIWHKEQEERRYRDE